MLDLRPGGPTRINPLQDPVGRLDAEQAEVARRAAEIQAELRETRLRLLAEYDALGPAAAATGDPGAWVIAAHHLAASAFVSEAAEGSVWAQLMAAVRTHAVRALAELGEAREGEGELDRRGSADFTALVDMERSVTLDGYPARSGNVLQVVRLPREHAGRTEKALVLLAPRSGG